MYYDHSRGLSQPLSQNGYYAVFIFTNGQYHKHVVKARSDFDAALKVKKSIGLMPSSDADVVGPLPSYSHGYDKLTRDLWLGKHNEKAG